MTKQYFQIPKGCKTITMEQIGNQIITTFEPEFKKGDVIYCEDSDGFNWVFILKEKINRELNPYDYFCLFISSGLIKMSGCCRRPNLIFRIATPDEAQLLWDALAKEGKWWNPETMQVEEIKKKRWRAEQFKEYYYISPSLRAGNGYDGRHGIDDILYEKGNHFQTEEQAQRAANRLQAELDKFWEEELK